MEDLNVEECTRELESLKNLQICLNGFEANALILAVQVMRASSLNREELAAVMNCAEIAALKLQKLFVSSPLTFSAIERGWQLSDRVKNSPPEDFPPEAFLD
ncbi:hypothetical protein [Microcoleus sp. Pol12B5]|uniref:hypothetical protein n=1 Tax=Microcoleus sp. Pol12B5 TaxID=3055396 RepID=UPI002FD68055